MLPDTLVEFQDRTEGQSLIGLLYTILVLFASQGRQVVQQIVGCPRGCFPRRLFYQYLLPYPRHSTPSRLRLPALGTQSFTAASNFEAAMAVAVAAYRARSP